MAVERDVIGAESLQVGDRVQLGVRGLASGGSGVADLPDGRVAFVRRTAPGDLVRARIVRLRPRWGEAALEDVLEPGPGRVEPRCPLYGACGGCTLQHLDYAEQLHWKRRFVADAMRRIGGLEIELPEVTPSPREIGYRNRMTFTLRRLRGGRIVAGLHGLREPDRIVDINGECVLPEPSVLAAWRALRRTWSDDTWPLPPARELRVTLRSLDEGVILRVDGGRPGWNPEILLERVPGLAGVWHHADGMPDPVRVAGHEVHESWGGERIRVDGRAFLQVNRTAAEPMVEHVVALAGPAGRAVDAYCGVGVYGRTLARRGWVVEGIELDAHACEAAEQGGSAGFTVHQGRVEERLPALLPADLLILNPPRAGLHHEIPSVLRSRPPARVVYVSCDPATLARDARRLGSRFRLAALRSFDLFPQTAHVETVALFTPCTPP